MDITEFVSFLFMRPLCLVLSDVIAIPDICEGLQLKFVEYLHLKYSLGSNISNQHTGGQMKCGYSYSVNEMMYIGERYDSLGILFKVRGLENYQPVRNEQLLKATYENLSSVYNKFSMNKNNQLLVRYVIYKYFKDKNYIVRDGLKFGVDYLLYNKSPSLVHGKHCILICKFTEDEGGPELKSKLGQENIMYNGKKYVVELPVIDYKKVISLSRLCESVSKKLILVEYDSKSQKVQSIQVSRYLG